MNLTRKQREFIDELLDLLRSKFPETRLIDLRESPESHNDIWIIVSAKDDEAYSDMIELAAERATDILVEYGYKFSVMPRVEDMATA